MINKAANLSDNVLRDAKDIVFLTARTSTKMLRMISTDPHDFAPYRQPIIIERGSYFAPSSFKNPYYGFCMVEPGGVFDIWLTPNYTQDSDALRVALLHELSHGYGNVGHDDNWRSVFNRSLYHYNHLVKDIADVRWVMQRTCKRYGSPEPKREAFHHVTQARVEHTRVLDSYLA